MGCTSPMKRWVNHDETWSKITGYHEKYVKDNRGIPIYKFQEIPCGKCIACRLEYSKQWANRCMLEAREHEENQFITLTYADEYLPKTKGINIETGEIDYEYATLKPEDLQKFMKDLRRYYEYHYDWKYKEHEVLPFDNWDRHENGHFYKVDNWGIRFYACGEYGTEKERPHYHIIAFNLPIFDKNYLFTDNKTGTKNYTSETIEKIWKKGIVGVADVTWESCAYVARYVMKKAKGRNAVELFRESGREQEFTRMSRNPGIAKHYYEQHKDKIYENDEIWLKNKKGAIKAKPARYFDKLYDLEHPELMEAIKKNRQTIAEQVEKTRKENSDLSREEYLEQQEIIMENRAKRLKRGLK